ncbi:heterokaryon incompatibility protein [Aspergillus luchuensis]|uniref:Heterokaryon incompatibility protein n=1 Tax=Aspergillus kawachii TaxID=1069201 RepID=A0A146FT59_ASPKA|nr:heterokaryon incompatibility protein [Aspergillus luchuensis]
MSGIIFILAFAAIGRGPPSPQTITSLEFNDMDPRRFADLDQEEDEAEQSGLSRVYRLTPDWRDEKIFCWSGAAGTDAVNQFSVGATANPNPTLGAPSSGVLPKMSFTSDPDADPNQTCPHVVLRKRADYIGIENTPIATFLINASICLDCNLVLQVIEAVKPGWVKKNAYLGLVDYQRAKSEDDWFTIVPQFTLHLQQPEGREDADLDQPTTFHFLKRAATARYEAQFFDWHTGKSPEYTGKFLAQSLEVTHDSGSPAAFERARHWLSYCDEHDEACKPPNPDYKPRRLINVGSLNGIREPFLFEPVEPVRYACLSYCWGKDLDQVLTTTTHNLESHYQAIELTTLPLALQDAITVCRSLEIPNLWVDSLCIVQDDRISWLHDASAMHDIYLNSYLTISVMEPNSCKMRFLGKQRFGDPTWQQLLCTTRPDTAPPLDLLIRPGKFYPRSYRDRSSLDTRGWCLQESVLPNRRLCYDGNEMIWECLCRQLCECGHAVAPQVPRHTTLDYGKLGASIKTEILKTKVRSERQGYPEWHRSSLGSRLWLEPHQAPYQRWRDLVSDYSHRSLTKKHDRLRAISGLAKMVGNHMRQGSEAAVEYLAGLWKKEIPFDLSWEVEPPNEGAEIPESGTVNANEAAYYIPTWSWASVGRPVTYRFDLPLEIWKYEPVAVDQCIVERVHCQHELLEDSMSAVTDGSIVLTSAFAPVKLIRLEELPEKQKGQVIYEDEVRYYTFVQCSDGQKFGSGLYSRLDRMAGSYWL